MPAALSRRAILGRSAALVSLMVRPAMAADYSFRQFHNQAATSPLHRRLVEMWAAIGAETGGRVAAEVFAENAGLAGSDPAALKMLMSGELDFFTLMGGILGQAVPVAEVQQVPFAFRTAAEAHAAADGALGAYLREEMAAKGIHGFAVGAFDNGMRQTSSTGRLITVPKDFEGLRIRLPAGQMFTDTFRALGAEPVTINVNGIYQALKEGKVDAQESPLAVNEVFGLYEVQKHLAMTNHMWSGFNRMANGASWRKLPQDIQATIERNAARFVAPSATIRTASMPGCARPWPSAAWSSTRSTRRPSGRAWPRSMPRGARSSAASAGPCSKAMSDGWVEGVLPAAA